MVDLNHFKVTSLSQLEHTPTIFKKIKIVFIKKKIIIIIKIPIDSFIKHAHSLWKGNIHSQFSILK